MTNEKPLFYISKTLKDAMAKNGRWAEEWENNNKGNIFVLESLSQLILECKKIDIKYYLPIILAKDHDDDFVESRIKIREAYFIHLWSEFPDYICDCLSGKKSPFFSRYDLLESEYHIPDHLPDNSDTQFYPHPYNKDDFPFIKPELGGTPANDEQNEVATLAAASKESHDFFTSISDSITSRRTSPSDEISLTCKLSTDRQLTIEVFRENSSTDKYADRQFVFEFLNSEGQPLDLYFTMPCRLKKDTNLIARKVIPLETLFQHKDMYAFKLLALEPDDITIDGDIFDDDK